MNFITIADDKFVFWFKQLYRFLRCTQEAPRIFLIDISSTKDNELSDLARRCEGVSIRHAPSSSWYVPGWVEEIDFNYLYPDFSVADQLKYFRRRLQYLLTGRAKPAWLIDKGQFVLEKKHAISLWANKPRFFRDTLSEVGDQLVYIDVDALPVKNLGELFDREFDIGFTTERPENIRIGRESEHNLSRPIYPYRAINTGVYCARRTDATMAFFDAWIASLDEVRHDLLDQTAVAWLLLQQRPDFFEHQEETVPIRLGSGTTVNVRNLCGDIYNCHRFELAALNETLDRTVYHFVGAHKRSDKMELLKVALDQLFARVSTLSEGCSALR